MTRGPAALSYTITREETSGTAQKLNEGKHSRMSDVSEGELGDRVLENIRRRGRGKIFGLGGARRGSG